MLQEPLAPPCACGGMRYAAAGQLGYGDGGGGGSVDCTLSLGTPSTRRADARAGGGAVASVAGRGSPARRCANCDTASTPLWRNGPRGPKSLCNACGIRYKKEERRAAAAAVAPAATQDAGLVGSYACGAYARQQQQRQPTQWGCYGSAAGAKSAPSSLATYGGSAAADGPCLSWMLNVMPSSPAFFAAVQERPTLFQYY